MYILQTGQISPKVKNDIRGKQVYLFYMIFFKLEISHPPLSLSKKNVLVDYGQNIT